MHRFFVPPQTLRTKDMLITGDTAHQMIRVLRMRPGDDIILLDGNGCEYEVRLITLGKEDVQGEVIAKRQGKGEPAHQVSLYMSVLNKPEKFEWALQKCTELGASRFVPVLAERSVSGTPGPAKYERWRRIILEAAEQSGRAILPILEETLILKQAFQNETDLLEEGAHVALIPALSADLTLRNALQENDNNLGSISLFIGPEGGFTDEELFQANESGVQLITLGPRTLRAETAAVAALAMVMYELGEMDRNT